jgi:DNA polymerase III epsilon subunit-like protein
MISIILDTETTGLLKPKASPLEKQPRIIEFGAMRIEGDKKVDEINLLIYPEMLLPEIIIKITGITDADLKGKPIFKKVYPKIEKFFKGTDAVFSHNLPFDSGMINNDCARIGKEFPWPAKMICTIQEYRPILGYRPKLIHLYEHYMGKPLAQTHRALDDAQAIYDVLLKDNYFGKVK